MSFSPTLKKEDGWLDFANHKTQDIINRFRATEPWPGSYAFISGKRLKVLEIETCDKNINPGKIENFHSNLIVGCLDGSLRLSRVQLEGKKATTDIDLLNGLKIDLILTDLPKAL